MKQGVVVEALIEGKDRPQELSLVIDNETGKIDFAFTNIKKKKFKGLANKTIITRLNSIRQLKLANIRKEYKYPFAEFARVSFKVNLGNVTSETTFIEDRYGRPIHDLEGRPLRVGLNETVKSVLARQKKELKKEARKEKEIKRKKRQEERMRAKEVYRREVVLTKRFLRDLRKDLEKEIIKALKADAKEPRTILLRSLLDEGVNQELAGKIAQYLFPAKKTGRVSEYSQEKKRPIKSLT